jgi:DNA polymerase-1
VDLAHTARQAWDNDEPLKQLDAQGQRFVYEHVEKPIVAATIVMIRNGMRLDAPRLEQLSASAKRKVDRLQKRIDRAAGGHVNITSQNALSAALYDQLHLPVIQLRRDGSPSTSTETLRQLAKLHPFVGDILALRETHATYEQARRLQQAVRADTGRIHGQLDPLGTETGRFTCTGPNLLGIPAELREAFIADPGHELIELDASQIELRVLAHFTRSPELLQAFQRGADLHRLTAAHVFGCRPQRVSQQQRSIGKGVNFAMIYGQSAAGLAGKLDVTRDEAQSYIDGFFRAYTGVAAWVEQIENEFFENGFVRTLYGRRRLLPDVNSDDRQKVRQAMRQAVNTIIQGTAADIHKLTIARLISELPSDCRLLLAVHDSVLIEIPTCRRRELTELFRDAMQVAPPEFTVPIKVKVGHGRNWQACSSTSPSSSKQPAPRTRSPT